MSRKEIASTRPPEHARLRWLVGPAFVLHATMLTVGVLSSSPTRNEVAHIPAGLDYWHTAHFQLYNANPPLSKLIATLPVLNRAVRVDEGAVIAAPGQRIEWETAQRFAVVNDYRYNNIVISCRFFHFVWSLLGCLIVLRWASEAYGCCGGLLSLALWCFGPNVIANAIIVSPDLPCAVAGLSATYAFWRFLRAGTVGWAATAGVLLGIAELTKFTLLILYAIWPLTSVCHVLDRRSVVAFRTLPFRNKLGRAALIASLSVLVINLGYGFAGSLTPLGEYEFVSRTLTGQIGDGSGNRFRDGWAGSILVPLPYDYLTGIDVQRRDLEGGMPPSYLAGEWRDTGWWYYYLYGLAVKVPLGTLALVFWSLWLTICRSRLSAAWADEITLWLPALAILAAASSQTGFSHHFRYVLPMAPFVFIATGKLAGYICWKTWKRGALVITLLGWSVISSLSVYPHSLSYFNELAGGPDRGHEHLVDSNIDWGQDLFFFQKWAHQHPEARPLGVAYFNYIDYRIVLKEEFDEVPPDPPAGRELTNANEAARYGPHPGWFAADIHNLMDPSGRCHYLMRSFKPVAKAGYSIFIYHITPEEAARVRREMSLPPLPKEDKKEPPQKPA